MTLDELLQVKEQQERPCVVCLCGSTRFVQAFQKAMVQETLAGKIVLSIGCNTKSDDDLMQAGVPIDKPSLDILHLWKIDLADEVLILNVGDYVGQSTRREVQYALRRGKILRWVEPTSSDILPVSSVGEVPG